MEKIIDAHCHLGDVLYPYGGEFIEKRGVKKRFIFDIVSLSEFTLHKYAYAGDVNAGWLNDLNVKSARERNFIATRENYRASLDKAGVSAGICLPIPPNVTFADLRTAAEKDSGIIPFTGIDYTREYDVEASLAADVAAGAKGIKLHPILQCTPLTSKKTFEAIEAFAPYELPILMHTGIAHYYSDEEEQWWERVSYGEIHYVRDVVKAFPRVHFIVGHAGLAEVRDVLDMLGNFKNVWVDISFQNVMNTRALISIFSPDKVLYASDWPFGDRITPIKVIKKACRGDEGIERRVFYENASELMHLSI